MMPSKFDEFAAAVRRRFAEMASEPLFVIDADRDAIWERYLAAFPPGSDPMFRSRTEHDCSCCRHFIRDVGGVVAVQNGAISTIWDLSGLPEHYQVVADAVAAYVRSLNIRDVYLTPHAGAHGTVESSERDASGSRTIMWRHFSVDVPPRFASAACDEARGAARTAHQVLLRGLAELDPGAVATVVGLIDDNALYRGAEHAGVVREFQRLQERAAACGTASERALLAWGAVSSPIARFHNTAIGTLVQDLSAGVDLEAAVRFYEVKVAPANYKRPKALITRGMVDAAMRTIQDLGLEASLPRRHARLSDVSVSSVLFVDGEVAPKMRDSDGVRSILMEEVRSADFDPKTAEAVGVDEFVGKVLPRCTSVRAYLDNALLGNFMSVTAPADPEAAPLFRWDNGFAWSYDGNVADSIKERVKRAGGQVEGVALRVSLAWHNYDDLDIHVRTPDGRHIYYGDKMGLLDVDMNAGARRAREPVENVRWVRAPRDGTYMVWVHQFCRRESSGVGFEVEVEAGRVLHTLRHDRGLGHAVDVPVADIIVRRGQVAEVRPSPQVVGGAAPREKWGLMTQRLVRVNAIILSPNCWGDVPVGNKHWFFLLDGARNPDPVRGMYNEFLHPRLDKHRKVLEVLGDKMKCPYADEQLSGIGFSSTRRDGVVVSAMGPRLRKSYAIAF